MNRLLLGVALSFVIVCQSALSEQPQPTKAEPGNHPGRYTITPAGDNLVLLDTVTGETWILPKGADPKKAEWVPIAKGPQSSVERVKIPLKSIHASVPYDDLQDVQLPADLVKKAQDKDKPTLFVVRATGIESAVKLTAGGLAKVEGDEPISEKDIASDKDQYWVVLYLGWDWISPAQWYIDSAKVEDGRVQIHISKTKKKGVSFLKQPYVYWIPIGKLKPGSYVLEVYDENQMRVTLAHKIKILAK